MRTAIIITLVVALGVAILTWRCHRKKEQEQENSPSGQPSLVNQSDLMEDRSNMETLLPPDMDWEAVGAHLEQAE